MSICKRFILQTKVISNLLLLFQENRTWMNIAGQLKIMSLNTRHLALGTGCWTHISSLISHLSNLIPHASLLTPHS